MLVTEYLQPGSLAEALALLAGRGAETTVLAGGTTVMPQLAERGAPTPRLLSLTRAGLRYLERDGDWLRIGAMTTLTDVAERSGVPLLAEAALQVGGWAVRNMGTVGGNLLAAPPHGDVAVALLALDARVTVAAPAAERTVPLSALYPEGGGGPLGPEELVREVRVPLTPPGWTGFAKLGRRQRNTPAVLTAAAWLRVERGRVAEARLALGAAAPRPWRAGPAEEVLTGAPLDSRVAAAAAAAAAAASQPASDAIASAWYRRRMVEVQVRRLLERAAAEAGATPAERSQP